MAWFKADDRIMEHHKFVSARAKGGHRVIGAWFHAGTWANGQMTDGFIPRSWATLNNALNEAEILVEVGLWDEDASRDGWQMHDYADYQPLKADLEAKSEQKRSSGQAGGKQTASRRAAKSKPVPVPEPEPTHLKVSSTRTTRISSKQERNIKRLGLEPTGGNAA
jgi:hypothetical protein